MDGQYEFIRMLLGLSGGTATFLSKAVDSISSHLKWRGVVCYVDDVLIGGKKYGEHLELLEQVLAAVSKAGFTVCQKNVQ